jgi:hypothetical protein
MRELLWGGALADGPNDKGLVAMQLAYPDFAHHYWFNDAERDGPPGVENDKNGFTDDISGWKSKETTGGSI